MASKYQAKNNSFYYENSDTPKNKYNIKDSEIKGIFNFKLLFKTSQSKTTFPTTLSPDFDKAKYFYFLTEKGEDCSSVKKCAL